ncbi:MAG TPA: Rieske (2Fe-2S) protein [Acidimicrobiia bacterium]|jgi:nitrite reductase/ring-hydroxylating ferredoxin subunit|nr:Rieske (2Fe-2S) protein [Acidimicrobiia bacterium]
MEWYDTGIPANAASPQRANLSGTPVILVHVDGTWLAVEDRCSHAGCAFSDDGEIDGQIAICNCHGSEFDVRSGAVIAGPADRPIRSYRTRQTGERLEVER